MHPELQAALEELARACSAHRESVDERIDRFETRLNRPGLSDPSQTPQAKLQRTAFGAYIKRGREGLTVEHLNVLKISDDARGGYLAPDDFIVEVLKNIVQFSPIRALTKPRLTSSGEVKIPKRTGTMTGAWVGETDDRTDTEPTYGLATIPINEAAFYVDCSNWQLEDAAVDMVDELAGDAAEEAGRLEGQGFVNGNGVTRPEGFMQNADVAFTASGAAADVTADGLIDCLYALKPFYRQRATWVMNGTTIAKVRKLKDATGAYLWQPGIAAGQPETILSRPVSECVDMPDTGANAFPVAIGDFQSGYRIYDRIFLSMLRDPFSLATKGQTRFHFRRRVGGSVVKAEAFRKIKCAV